MTAEQLARLQQLLLAALDPPPAEARRLIHGRGQCWPGLEQISVDWLQGILLVTLFREPAEDTLQALQQMLRALVETGVWQTCQGRALLLQLRYRRENANLWLHGAAEEHCLIEENGLHYRLDLGSKQNSGLFLDMRLGRQWVQQQADGLRVLNLFAYTCGFSVAALAGGARHVLNLDMARAALNRGRENHRLNRQDLSRVGFLDHDLFNSWGKLRRNGPWDLIIIDPPSQQKGSFIVPRDYRKILRRLPELLSERGRVLACLNAPELGSDFLIGEMAREAPALAFVERLANPEEFPDIDPQRALKVLLFRQPPICNHTATAALKCYS
jgi:23S rRNA (cytosine1962-C5)-methyltransferase